jgi:peptidyl-prolyl cis-trans isomerase B (cyclophilin B)
MFSTEIKHRRVTGITAILNAITCLVVCLACGAGPVWAAEQFARIHTDSGEILVELNSDLAPAHVEHFLHLARTGFFDGTSFHRIVPGFVIQGGDPNSKDDDPRNDGQGGPTLKDVLDATQYAQFLAINESLTSRGYVPLPEQVNVKAEFSTTANHQRGVLSMARARANDSAGSQFFICVADRFDLDGKYTIFGYVVSGMEVVDAIVSAPRLDESQTPLEPVRIQRVEVLTGLDDLTEIERSAWQEHQTVAGSP